MVRPTSPVELERLRRRISQSKLPATVPQPVGGVHIRNAPQSAAKTESARELNERVTGDGSRQTRTENSVELNRRLTDDPNRVARRINSLVGNPYANTPSMIGHSVVPSLSATPA